jgi:tetratricopeptide (TPR) repeat protein
MDAGDFAASEGDLQGGAITGQTQQAQFQGNIERKEADLGDQLLLDVVVSGAGKLQPIRERAQAILESADKKLKTKPDDLDARFTRAMAHLRLGENQKALDDLQVVLGKNHENIPAERYPVITRCRLGQKQDTLTKLATFQKEEVSESTKLSLAIAVAAELGEGLDKAIEALAAAIKKRPSDPDVKYDAVRAFSVASRAVSRSDMTKSRKLAERSLELLSESAKSGNAHFGKR